MTTAISQKTIYEHAFNISHFLNCPDRARSMSVSHHWNRSFTKAMSYNEYHSSIQKLKETIKNKLSLIFHHIPIRFIITQPQFLHPTPHPPKTVLEYHHLAERVNYEIFSMLQNANFKGIRESEVSFKTALTSFKDSCKYAPLRLQIERCLTYARFPKFLKINDLACLENPTSFSKLALLGFVPTQRNKVLRYFLKNCSLSPLNSPELIWTIYQRSDGNFEKLDRDFEVELISRLPYDPVILKSERYSSHAFVRKVFVSSKDDARTRNAVKINVLKQLAWELKTYNYEYSPLGKKELRETYFKNLAKLFQDNFNVLSVIDSLEDIFMSFHADLNAEIFAEQIMLINEDIKYLELDNKYEASSNKVEELIKRIRADQTTVLKHPLSIKENYFRLAFVFSMVLAFNSARSLESG